MRNKERIPIIFKFFRHNARALYEFLEEGISEEDLINLHTTPTLSEFYDYWSENYDQRLGQALINFGLIQDNLLIWIKEEVEWLIDKGYLNPEDIIFWRVNYNIDGTRKEETEYRLLKDLGINHIKNIIKFFGDNVNRIEPIILNYFRKRIEGENEV